MRRLVIVAAIVVTGCSAGAGIVDTPDATARPTAMPTKAPWPARFEANLCLAMEEFPSLQEDMEDLEAAANDENVDAVLTTSAIAGRRARSVDANLEEIAGDYAPARPLMVAWRRMNRVLIRALDKIHDGLSTADLDMVEDGSADLNRAGKLIAATTPLIEEFGETTGFVCP